MKKFFEFLKKNKVLEQYLSNLSASTDFNEYPEDYISRAFYWYGTKEGSDFWRDIHEKWLKELKNSSNS